MITYEQAIKLRHGQILHDVVRKNADGTPVRWRVNGATKVWKTRPGHFRVPLKHGMWDYDYVDQDTAGMLEIAED